MSPPFFMLGVSLINATVAECTNHESIAIGWLIGSVLFALLVILTLGRDDRA